MAFADVLEGWGQNLRVGKVEICLCAKNHQDPRSRCCVRLFQSWSLSTLGGGRAAHFGLCVAVGRSCVGLSAGRAGSWRGRTETAAVPAELCRRRPLLPKDDCDRDEVRDLRPELFSVGISVAAYSGWPRLAQGQEILNKMRALLCSAGGGGACYTARQARASNTLRWLREGAEPPSYLLAPNNFCSTHFDV